MTKPLYNFEAPKSKKPTRFNVIGQAELISSMTSVPKDLVDQILRSWAMHLMIHGVIVRRTRPHDLCRGCLHKHFDAVNGMPRKDGFFAHELDHLDEWLPCAKDITLAVLSALMTCLSNEGFAPHAVLNDHRDWSRDLEFLEEDECQNNES